MKRDAPRNDQSCVPPRLENRRRLRLIHGSSPSHETLMDGLDQQHHFEIDTDGPNEGNAG